MFYICLDNLIWPKVWQKKHQWTVVVLLVFLVENSWRNHGKKVWGWKVRGWNFLQPFHIAPSGGNGEIVTSESHIWYEFEIHIKSSTQWHLLEIWAVPKIFFFCKICRLQFGLIIFLDTFKQSVPISYSWIHRSNFQYISWKLSLFCSITILAPQQFKTYLDICPNVDIDPSVLWHKRYIYYTECANFIFMNPQIQFT